jgi:hypothetical protein
MRSVPLDRLTFVKREKQRPTRSARMKRHCVPVLGALAELNFF